MSGKFTVEILNAKSLKPVVTLNLNSDANVLDAKKAIYAQSNFYFSIFFSIFLYSWNVLEKYLYTDRQMLRSEQSIDLFSHLIK